MPVPTGDRLPNARVEIAFDSGFTTAAADRTWTDVSAYVEGTPGITIARGRSDELAQVQPSVLTVTLDNSDGRFTPGNTAGAYYPNVKKGRPIRVVLERGGVDYDRFTGYVSEWPVVWPDGTDAVSTVTVTASSRLSRLGSSAPLPSAIRTEYLADDPVEYFPMNDDGHIIAGVNNDVNVWQSALDPTRFMYAAGPERSLIRMADIAGPTDEGNIPAFPEPNTSDVFRDYAWSGGWAINTAGEATVEAVVRVPDTNTLQTICTLLRLSSQDGSRIADFTLAYSREFGVLSFVTGVDLNYRDFVTPANNQFPVHALTDAEAQLLSDGGLHHVALTITGDTLKGYIDGEFIGSTAFTGVATMVGTPFTYVSVGTSTLGSDLWEGHVAVYDSALSVARIAVHARAALSSTESVAERVERIAAELGVPAAEVVAEDSDTPLSAQPQLGRSGLEVLSEIADTEGGVLYDGKDGTLRLDSRAHRFVAQPAFTLDAATEEIGGDLAAMLDDRYLINEMGVASATEGGASTVSTNTASVAEYGLYRQDKTLVTNDPQLIAQVAQFTANRYGDPAPRISQVTVDLTNLDASQVALVLAADIGTQMELVNLPAQAPAASMLLFAEGYSETITATSHMIAFNTTPRLLSASPFILDSSVLDGPDVLVY